MSERKLILVLGATGAQGIAVIDALLAPDADGSSSPYAVRALTRDPESKRAQDLKAKGVECVQGSFEDFLAVYEALKGVYGVWTNTDGFTVGETREVFAGMRIFELAKQVGSVRHYVWSNLDYVSKIAKYNPDYRVEHYDGKGRVADWMKAQPSDAASENGMAWSVVTTGPYMDMLKIGMFGPLTKRSDGTYVFASPIGDGHVPMISLRDLGYFARYVFDHPVETSGKDLEVASQLVGWDGEQGLIETFRRVTGLKAVFVRQGVEEWMANFLNTERSAALDVKGGTTWKDNFSAFWRMFRDDVIKRDMEWILSINPDGDTLESWMRANNYPDNDPKLLKNLGENHGPSGLNLEAIEKLKTGQVGQKL